MKNRTLAAFMAVCVGIGLLWKSGPVAQGARLGLENCANVVIPSLFPFMILAGLIASTSMGETISRWLWPITGRLMGMPRPLGSVLLMSFVGGFPVGARMLSQLYAQGELSKEDCESSLCCCVNAGPSFLISAVGAGMLGSLQAGALLLLAQFLSAVLIGAWVFHHRPASLPTLKPAQGRHGGFVEAVQGASAGILGICAFVVAFSALTALLQSLGIFSWMAQWFGRVFPACPPAFWNALFTGILEVTSGCVAAAALPGKTGFLLCAFLVSFSSLSILFQVRSCFPVKAGISFRKLYWSRLIHGGFTCLLASLFWKLLPPQVLSALSSSVRPLPVARPEMGVTCLCLICMCTILVFSRKPNT